jgi:tetratricopeptide (TPR) repeat protein
MRHIRVLPLLAILALALPLSAQTAPCPIDLLQPAVLGIANLQRQSMMNAKSPDDARKALKNATKQLFDPKTASNPLGRDFLTAQFFTLAIENGGELQTRDALGMPGNKDEKIDLLHYTDSLFTIVLAGEPKCAAEVKEWRMYKPYMSHIQAGYKAITDAGNTAPSDSVERRRLNNVATAEGKRALVISRDGAQAYDVLWRAAKNVNDQDGVITNLKLAADKLQGDTTNAAVRANLMFNLGRVQQDYASLAAEPKKSELQRGAAKAFLAVMQEYPTSEEAPFALQGIGIAAAVTKDEALNIAALDLIKANPSKFSGTSLAQAGVIATRAGKSADAVALFEAATKSNPYSRDYVYNFAAMLYEAKRPSEMIPVVKKLLTIDPSNPDNVMLFAYAYKGQSDSVNANFLKKAQKDSAARYVKADLATKKALRDTISVWRKEYNRLIDSVTTYSKLSDEMPHKLTYTELDMGKDKASVKGTIENRAKTAKSFTVVFEFLGKDGSVAGKATSTVGPVAAGATAEFSAELKPAEGTKLEVVGVRYAALPLK